MTKEDIFEVNGTVLAAKGNGMFTVMLDGQEQPFLCTISGKVRNNSIKIIEGSYVKVAISVSDMTRGRITYRIK